MYGVKQVYFIGTAVSLLAALFGLANSVGGLMYPQGSGLADDNWTVWTEIPLSLRETAANTKRIGSK